MLTLASAAVLFIASPEEDAAALYGEPDVYSVSFSGYTSLGQNNFEMHMLMEIYLDSLYSAVDSLHSVLRGEFSISPDLLEALDLSHASFLNSSTAWAFLVEEREWWNTEEGVRFDGSARGYTYAFSLAELLWQKICEYEEMIAYGPGRDNSPGQRVEIGGYKPGSSKNDRPVSSEIQNAGGFPSGKRSAVKYK